MADAVFLELSRDASVLVAVDPGVEVATPVDSWAVVLWHCGLAWAWLVVEVEVVADGVDGALPALILPA